MKKQPPFAGSSTWLAIASFIVCGLWTTRVAGQDEFEKAPIQYSLSEPQNTISWLQQQLEQGELTLSYDEQRGYLPSLLEALDVPIESQMLVFSKTSLQIQRISPRTPRAIYFNDDIYVGYCQSGDVLEISAADAKLGTVFYTLDQAKSETPQFVRQTDNCLICHSSSRTESVPGHLVRSLFVDVSGRPILSAGSLIVNHTTPFEERWGGWYVTGTHGQQTHRGNLIIRGQKLPRTVDNSDGQNVKSLEERINVSAYLSPHSDIVSLMVLEHQALVHNRITKANFTTRQALAYDEMMNRTLGTPDGPQLESTTRRIHNACQDLVEALLFVDEAPLNGKVVGTSAFATTFTAIGPADQQGRSLRDFDLETRLFRYPCSYLIYSSSFAGLPPEAKETVWKLLWEVLSGQNDSQEYAHLTAEDRRAILQILRATIADLPDNWNR